MRVSVIMPTYNRSGMVRTAIESFLNQDYENSELVILDNGSTDETPEILKEYSGNKRINIITCNHNLIPPRNFNELLAYTSGDLICHLHDDDSLTKDGLSLRVKKFVNEPWLQVVYAGWITGGKTYLGQPVNAQRIITEEYVNFTTLMFRKELDLVMDTSLRYYHDWLFKIKCFQEYKVGYIPEPVMNYTIHLGQASIQCRELGMNGPEEKLMREIIKKQYGI